eukprot:CAMPEP_0194228520 /NCGR_PEP_ID=MMETSP0156-20130528/43415_1 /TAXON_ID=33649 /ORGANISM="Thalassionema nitzschioides, Strain L26-B" /LENGTH=693 /DNA_ID=CAMNT_0038961037 /DNA_START=26 /DNA_END=2108 /DNA_ORIENTATION=+
MPKSIPSPPARCAHSTVYYNGALYVFGGELASSDYYHHYKDLWRYDIAQQRWRELQPPQTGTLPSSRSGHAAMVWKSYMIVFGGFYEAARDNAPRWFNDVYVFNLKTECWLEVPHSKLGNRPEPRSACNISLMNDDTVVLHGGFSKLLNTSPGSTSSSKETKVHTDIWLLHLKPILQNKPPAWEKILSSSKISSSSGSRDDTNNNNPNGRSACASCTYKNQMIVFGGVLDAELLHHKVDSVFFNDIFGLQVQQQTHKPKWFPIRAQRRKPTLHEREEEEDDDDEILMEYSESVCNYRVRGMEEEKETPPAAAAAAAGTQQEDDDDDDDDDDLIENDDEEESSPIKGWDVNQLRENMFAFVDGKGNVVYEKKVVEAASGNDNNNDSSDDDEEDEEKEEEKEEDDDDSEEEEETKTTDGDNIKPSIKTISSTVMMIDPQARAPQAVPQQKEPLPRIKCGAIIHRNSLFIYGGLVEIGDREVTLDDMWCLDLKKRSSWQCIYPGTMHKQVWRGAEVHDDDDSYISSTAGGDDDDDSEFEENDLAPTTKTKRDDNRDPALVEELLQLISKHDLGNETLTPQHDEALADYYSRTKDYWNERANESLLTAKKGANDDGDDDELIINKKELKREGFQMARQQFDDLEPVLQRFQELKVSTGQPSTTRASSSNNTANNKPKKEKKKKDKKEKKKKSKKEEE